MKTQKKENIKDHRYWLDSHIKKSPMNLMNRQDMILLRDYDHI